MLIIDGEVVETADDSRITYNRDLGIDMSQMSYKRRGGPMKGDLHFYSRND